MKETNLFQVLRNNLPLTLALALALFGVGVGLVMALRGADDVPVVAQLVTLNPNTVMGEEQMRAVLFAPPPTPRPTLHEQKRQTVNEHRVRYDANPADPDAEALLRAMGNLYKQIGDLENAAWALEQFLKRFPDSPSRTGVFAELAACYDQLGDTDNMQRVYLEMMKVFPPDSNEYKYAEARMHMSDLKLRERNPNAKEIPGPDGVLTVEPTPDAFQRNPNAEPDAAADTAAEPAPGAAQSAGS